MTVGADRAQSAVRLRRLHAYAASFGDDLARDLIQRFTQTDSIVLDPFVGGGTSLLQARFLRRTAIGIDIDPVACLISTVATSSYKSHELAELEEALTEQLAAIQLDLSRQPMDDASWAPGATFSINGLSGTIPNTDRISFWFAPPQRAVIAALVQLAEAHQDRRLRSVLQLAVSSSIVRKWPNTLSLARDIDHSRPHRVEREGLTPQSQIHAFLKVFRVITSTLRQARDAAGDQASPVWVIEGDATGVLNRLPAHSVDYILTSPPYFNAIDYPRAHQFSAWWLWPEREPLTRSSYVGLRPGGLGDTLSERCVQTVPACMRQLSALKEVPGFPFNRLCRYVLDLDAVFGAMVRTLRPGKNLTLVLANNSIRRVSVPVVDIVVALLRRRGLVQVALHPRSIAPTRRRYPYGLKGFRGLMESEYVITAKKSAR